MKLIIPDFEYTGWEISPDCLIMLQQILIHREIHELNIVEFGSGKSTQILSKFKEINNLIGSFDSFDADPAFAHPIAKIRGIKSYDGRPISFGNDYAFYDLSESDFSSDKYNLVILDGHHGHGISVAWDYLKNRLTDGCIVLIDDYDHYPFVDDFLKHFPKSSKLDSMWKINERWVIYEVIHR